MSTEFFSLDHHRIHLVKIPGVGAPWVVRVYRRLLFWRRLISSDWFLDETQARKFVEQLRKELVDHRSIEQLRGRKPGWTLHRPPR